MAFCALAAGGPAAEELTSGGGTRSSAPRSSKKDICPVSERRAESQGAPGPEEAPGPEDPELEERFESRERFVRADICGSGEEGFLSEVSCGGRIRQAWKARRARAAQVALRAPANTGPRCLPEGIASQRHCLPVPPDVATRCGSTRCGCLTRAGLPGRESCLRKRGHLPRRATFHTGGLPTVARSATREICAEVLGEGNLFT